MGDIIARGLAVKNKKDIQTLNSQVAGIDSEISDINLQISSISTQLTQKANQADLDALDDRVDQIITTPAESVSAQEIIDARQGKTSLGENLTSIKNDFAQQRQQDQLKIVQVERELSGFKEVIQQVNVNQEAKQKVSGYGIISLPKNAANGQVSVTLKGLTATNIINNGNFANGTSGWRGINATINVSNNIMQVAPDGSAHIGWLVQDTSYPIFPSRKYFIKAKLRVTNNDCVRIRVLIRSTEGSGDSLYAIMAPVANQWYSLAIILDSQATHAGNFRLLFTHEYADAATANGKIMEVQEVMVIDLTAHGLESKTVEELTKMFANYFDGTKSTVSAMRIRIVSEDEAEGSTAYVLAKDEDGNIEELRSLPNGTKDEIRLTDKKLIKRIGYKTNVASGTVIDYSDMATGGQFVAYFADGTQQVGVKGDTITALAATLIYQLAEPIITPVQVSGTLVSYPSGTVYIERVVPDAGLYTDKMTVLHQDLPIKALEKLSKIDYATGLETELDTSKAIIASDRLSFTHPNLTENDIVFFVYEYHREGTIGETEVEYYDSRYVVKDSVTNKFYKWAVAVANGVPSITLTEV